METTFSFRLISLQMWGFDYFLVFFGVCYLVEKFWDLLKAVQSIRTEQQAVEKGSWALVTGSTDGIGQGFAFVLASKGYNIIQVARNPRKLEDNGNEIYSRYGVLVKNIVKDFSVCTKNPILFFKDILDQCKGCDISLVVNNVGTSYSNTLFNEVSESKILELMSLNIFPTVFLTSLFTPIFAKREKGGGFINLSSVLGNVKYERYSLYCAVKAFVREFSILADLDNQVTGNNRIKTLCLQPGYVLTPLTSSTKGKFLVIDRILCAENALRLLGSTSCTHGYWKHILSGLIYRLVNYKTFMLIKKLNSY